MTHDTRPPIEAGKALIDLATRQNPISQEEKNRLLAILDSEQQVLINPSEDAAVVRQLGAVPFPFSGGSVELV